MNTSRLVKTPTLPSAVCVTGMQVSRESKTIETFDATNLVQCLNFAHVDLHSEYHKKFNYIEKNIGSVIGIGLYWPNNIWSCVCGMWSFTSPP